MGQKSAILLFLVSAMCLHSVISLSCYKYYKTSIKPEDLPKESGLTKVDCVSPNNVCEVRVVRVKATKQLFSVDLKCNTKINCEGAGTGCNGTLHKGHDSCGHCCQTDYCNKPEIAKFEINKAHTFQSNGLLILLVVLTTFYRAVC